MRSYFLRTIKYKHIGPVTFAGKRTVNKDSQNIVKIKESMARLKNLELTKKY